jgi:TRAP-type C4-dicarboxylate transport system substrate-binding protein
MVRLCRPIDESVGVAIFPASGKKPLNLFVPPQTQSQGDLSPVYRRADLSRAMMFVVALLLTAVSTSVLAREFRAPDTQSEDCPTVQALHHMGSLVAERSGRLQLMVFHSRQLGTRVPAVNVPAMPFLFRSIEPQQKVLDGPIGNEILTRFEPYGFAGLAFYDSGARSIYSSFGAVHSLDDVKGLRIRVQRSEQMSDMIRALGGEPVELPYGQMLTGLATKLIDGAENNWPSFVTTDHYKFAGYYTRTEHTMSPEVLVMSQKAWASLLAEDRYIFREAAMVRRYDPAIAQLIDRIRKVE